MNAHKFVNFPGRAPKGINKVLSNRIFFSFSLSSVQSNRALASDSKKVTFGLTNNRTAGEEQEVMQPDGGGPWAKGLLILSFPV